MKKSRMPVAPKTGEGAAGRAGKGLLLRRNKGDPMAKMAERDRRSPRGKKSKAKKSTKGDKRLRSRRGRGRGGGTRLGQGIGQVVAKNPGVPRHPLKVYLDTSGRESGEGGPKGVKSSGDGRRRGRRERGKNREGIRTKPERGEGTREGVGGCPGERSLQRHQLAEGAGGVVAGAEEEGKGEGAGGAKKKNARAAGAMGGKDGAIGPGSQVSWGKTTEVVGSKKEAGLGRVRTETRGVAKGQGEGEGGEGGGREGWGGEKGLAWVTQGRSERVGKTEIPPG